MLIRRQALSWFCALGLIGAPCAVHAQDAPEPAGAEAAGDNDNEQEMVSINLPENTNLKTLVDFVAARLSLNIVYDATIQGRQITLKTTTPVPVDSLRELVESMLAINGMMLVETDAEGILRVTRAEKLGEHAGVPLAEGDEVPKGKVKPVVSRIYKLEHAGVERASEVLVPFINTASGASIVKLPRHDMLIITDFVSNLERIERMLEIADQPGREVATRFVKIEHLNATELNTQVTRLLEAQAKISGDDNLKQARYALVVDERTNQIIVAAPAEFQGPIEQVIKSLDVSLDMKTKVFRLSAVSPLYLDEVIRGMIGPDKAERLYKAVPEEDSGFLTVTTTPQLIDQIDELVETIDQPVPETSSPIRFYKLQNASAQSVAETLNGIVGDAGLGTVTFEGFDAVELPESNPSEADSSDQPASSGSQLPKARVMADTDTNTIIVVAPPGLQPIYESLIQRLDARRPQVRIEATIVALDTTDDFSLGVEFSRSDAVDGGTLLNFSQFGLSTADNTTGALTLNPGLGFNGALLSADVAEIVIQALQRDNRSRIVTRPSVLVNDNAEGQLESIETEPFESVNANAQVATTSFGGELEAGTLIKVKPSISDGDFLKLDYAIEISSFIGERTTTSNGGTLPPARTENNINSSVTIPDGHTIVVGGLTRDINNETIQRIPVLGQIPIIEYAFSNRNTTKRQITLFVFLRAYVLRDDKFVDLKVLSGSAAGRAQLPSKFPTSLPVEIQ